MENINNMPADMIPGEGIKSYIERTMDDPKEIMHTPTIDKLNKLIKDISSVRD